MSNPDELLEEMYASLPKPPTMTDHDKDREALKIDAGFIDRYVGACTRQESVDLAKRMAEAWSDHLAARARQREEVERLKALLAEAKDQIYSPHSPTLARITAALTPTAKEE
jgi:hypothetical protein